MAHTMRHKRARVFVCVILCVIVCVIVCVQCWCTGATLENCRSNHHEDCQSIANDDANRKGNCQRHLEHAKGGEHLGKGTEDSKIGHCWRNGASRYVLKCIKMYKCFGMSKSSKRFLCQENS